eukprot:SAG31_NODE_1283_length_9011_cov_2.475202_9_plen_93_part_00
MFSMIVLITTRVLESSRTHYFKKTCYQLGPNAPVFTRAAAHPIPAVCYAGGAHHQGATRTARERCCPRDSPSSPPSRQASVRYVGPEAMRKC